jgi:hypothetical protein
MEGEAVNIHSLRHTYASIAIACGIALVVVSLLPCKKHPSVYLKAHKELPPEASAE